MSEQLLLLFTKMTRCQCGREPVESFFVWVAGWSGELVEISSNTIGVISCAISSATGAASMCFVVSVLKRLYMDTFPGTKSTPPNVLEIHMQTASTLTSFFPM